MTFGIPQIIWLALAFMGLGISIVKHGDSRPDYSAWTTLVSMIIEIVLLYFGGFFG